MKNSFIAKKHLWREERDKHGLEGCNVKIEDEAIERIIAGYTRESGVRELKRKLAEICRNLAETVARKDFSKAEDSLVVTASDLDEMLGSEQFSEELTADDHVPGVATGLAWTPMGGEILLIEAKQMPGKGKLTITGQLGDVMKESLHIAMSHIRANLQKINGSFDFDKHDIHVHVPSGAIPKDGPSAGITMFSALISLIAQKSIDPKIAMSGEITLRGAVLPVGGIKEKVIAAHRAGVRKVLLSTKNKKDLRDIPKEVRNDLDIKLVATVDEVMQEGLDLEFDLNATFEVKGLERRKSGASTKDARARTTSLL